MKKFLLIIALFSVTASMTQSIEQKCTHGPHDFAFYALQYYEKNREKCDVQIRNYIKVIENLERVYPGIESSLNSRFRTDTYLIAHLVIFFNHLFTKALEKDPELISMLSYEGCTEKECYTLYRDSEADKATTYQEFKYMFLFFIRTILDHTFREQKETIDLLIRQELIMELTL